jgi:predicted NBD/HSP70 family sugar kinase
VLTTGILNLIYLFDPEKIVLGGPLSALFARVEPQVKKALAANRVSGNLAGLVGMFAWAEWAECAPNPARAADELG